MTGEKGQSLTGRGTVEATGAELLISVPAVATLAAGLGSGAAIAMMPGVLSAFVSTGVVAATQSSRMGALELGGITASMLGYGMVLARFDRRTVAVIATTLIALGQFACLWPMPITSLLLVRAVLGMAEGALIGCVTAAIAGSALPERLFALWFSANLVVSAAFYAGLPALLSLGQMHGVLGAMIGLALIALIALRWLPRDSVPEAVGARATQPTAGGASHAFAASLAMLGSLLLFCGIGAIWPLMAQIGSANGVVIGTVSASLSAASFVGVASGLFASWLGKRLGHTIPVLAGTLGLSSATLLLLYPNAAAFALSATMFMACWIVSSTFYLGVVASLDRSGKLATFTFALQFLGLTFGQALSSLLADGGSFDFLIIAAALLALAALLVMMIALWLARVTPHVQPAANDMGAS